MSQKPEGPFQYKELYVFFANSIPFDGSTLSKKPLGGSESAVIYMAREFAQKGKKVIVFTQTEHAGHFDGVEYQPLSQFLGFIQRNILDVFISMRNVDVFSLPIHARKKVLWMQDAHDQPHLTPLASRDVQNKIDLLITVSQWQADQFINHFKFPKERVFVSRNGVNRKFYKKYNKKRKKQLVYTSTPFRGLELLLDVFPEIKDAVPEVELHVYSSMKVYGMSDEEDQENFKHIYKKCDQPGVKLCGSIRQEFLAKRLSESYLFVYPNYFEETSCIAALEAQAAGLPCVVSSLGALVETVQDGATGCNLGEDVHSNAFKKRFVEAVIGYLTNPDIWEAQSQKAHDRILNQFTWDKIAGEWLQKLSEDTPTLSLCMIVKNEEKNLDKCLESVEGLVDEIILVDTGSTDKTIEIASEYDAKIQNFKWQDDFSLARNFSLKKATGDWILVLDADETLSRCDLTQIRKFLNIKDATAFRLLQRSYLHDSSVSGFQVNQNDYEEGLGFPGYHDSFLVRLFRNHMGFQFEGKVHETIENSILEKNLNITNTNIPIHHFGKVLGEKKEHEKGTQYLEIGKQKVNKDKKDPKAFKELAIQSAELGKFDEAEDYFKETLRLDPTDITAMSDLAVILIKKGECLAGVEYLKEILRVSPQYIPAYVNLSSAYQKLEDYKTAQEYLEKAFSFAADHPMVLKELGLLSFRLQNFEKACQYFKKLKKVNPAECQYKEVACSHFELAKIFFQNQDFGPAEREIKAALQIISNFPRARNLLGNIHLSKNDFPKAISQFQEVIESCKMDPAFKDETVMAYIHLGYLENYRGNFKDSLDYLEHALQLDSNRPDIYNHLGIAKCGVGELEQALAFFDKALELEPTHEGARVNSIRIKEVLIRESNAASQTQEN